MRLSLKSFTSETSQLVAGLIALLTMSLSPIVSAQTEPLSIEPIAIEISKPSQTEDLTVLKFNLPLQALIADNTAEWWCLNSEFKGDALRWLVPERSCLSVDQLKRSTNPESFAMTWYALLNTKGILNIDFSLTTSRQQDALPISVNIDLAQAKTGKPVLLSEWAEARNALLESYRYQYFGPTRTSGWGVPAADSLANQNLLAHWQTIAALHYGIEDTRLKSNTGRRNRPGNRINAFSLFSGEAAIQETLQQQLLTTDESNHNAALNRHIEELSGPDAPSHPFQQLLAGRAGGELPIARLVPEDRWFLYISDPNRAMNWLEEVASNVNQLAGLSQQSYFDRELVEQYLQRLHFSTEFIERFSPLTKQAALFGPDLYLQHGSHITLVAQAPKMPGLSLLLKALLGLSESEGEVYSYGDKPAAYFARHDQWLIFSTSYDEVRQALQLARTDGKDSLGESTEFRYMAEQLPPAENGLYLYLSDPFIRAMTGPKIKIGQLRRHQARARLQLLTAASMLYQADQGRTPKLEELVSSRYIDPNWLQDSHGDKIVLNDAHQFRSSLYGSLSQMTPLSDFAIDAISEVEAEGYQQYVDDYSRFWRTTFDPIAVHIEVGEAVQIETLILPLINNSIYDAVRASIGGTAAKLTMPKVTPAPITALSFKLPIATLQQFEGQWLHRSRRNRNQEQGDLLSNALGGQLHLALFDDEPLIGLGSADLVGAFSGPFLTGRRGGLSLYGGLVASMLIQPAALFIELREGSDVQGLLNGLSQIADFGFGRRTLERYGKEGWVYTFNLENIIRYHLYIYQHDRYLVISNRPQPLQIEPATTSSTIANAALEINFSQIEKLGATLHLHAMQAQQKAWRRSVGQLLPLRWLNTTDANTAQTMYGRVFGLSPQLPPAAQAFWPWPESEQWQASESYLASELDLPAYHELSPQEKLIGPFSTLERLRVDFKLVDEGVRVSLQLIPRDNL